MSKWWHNFRSHQIQHKSPLFVVILTLTNTNTCLFLNKSFLPFLSELIRTGNQISCKETWKPIFFSFSFLLHSANRHFLPPLCFCLLFTFFVAFGVSLMSSASSKNCFVDEIELVTNTIFAVFFIVAATVFVALVVVCCCSSSFSSSVSFSFYSSFASVCFIGFLEPPTSHAKLTTSYSVIFRVLSVNE